MVLQIRVRKWTRSLLRDYLGSHHRCPNVWVPCLQTEVDSSETDLQDFNLNKYSSGGFQSQSFSIEANKYDDINPKLIISTNNSCSLCHHEHQKFMAIKYNQ